MSKGKYREFELEKRFNAMELSIQRQLQARDREIMGLKLRISDLEDTVQGRPAYGSRGAA
ncbi:MAG: hypothetical protein WC277_08025 [Bacilli bacterium]